MSTSVIIRTHARHTPTHSHPHTPISVVWDADSLKQRAHYAWEDPTVCHPRLNGDALRCAFVSPIIFAEQELFALSSSSSTASSSQSQHHLGLPAPSRRQDSRNTRGTIAICVWQRSRINGTGIAASIRTNDTHTHSTKKKPCGSATCRQISPTLAQPPSWVLPRGGDITHAYTTGCEYTGVAS